MKTLINFWIIILSGSLLLGGCGSRENAGQNLSKPNILWITAEDIGPALGAYGDPHANTPNLDQLASEGIVYKHAYATAPICAPARSSIITGIYPTSQGTQHLRSEIPMPDKLKGIPEYLQQKGYYTTNGGKTDYNFDPEGMWDVNSHEDAHWRNRPESKPFFSVFNYGITHEGHVNIPQPADFEALNERQDQQELDLPPYLPDTPEMRKIWARQYDLITVLDQKVGALIDQLKEDGLYNETIIFFYGDHGYGLPYGKRWLTKTGLQVPLIVRVPEKYQHLAPEKPGTKTNRLVSFVDLAPTMLNIVDMEIPDHMQGQPFLGENIGPGKDYVFASRSRADDVYDVSRAILDQEFIYKRNYMPHHPYVIDALIFSDRKAGFRELRRLRQNGALTGPAKAFFQPKPVEELYNLKEDPYELNNLAGNPEYRQKLKTMRDQLRNKILETRDIGFLNEAEMMRRAEEGGTTPYEYAQSGQYQLENILNAAEMVGKPTVSEAKLRENLNHQDSGVRFWGLVTLLAKENHSGKFQGEVVRLLEDSSPIVQIKAAELLCQWGECEKAYPVLERHLKTENKPWLVLQAAISIRRIGNKAAPMESVVKTELQKYKGDVGMGYSSWSYPMFIGFALDQVLININDAES